MLSVGRIHNSNVFKTTIQIDFIHSVPFARDIDSVLAYCLCQTRTKLVFLRPAVRAIVICLIYASMHRSQCSDPRLVLAIMEQLITRTSCDTLHFFLLFLQGCKTFVQEKCV